MEKSKLVKVLTILIIVAICLISFAGIFVTKQGQMKNILPNYTLGMNLNGARVIKFKVSEKTEEVVYDAQGNITTDGTNEDGSLKEGYKKENKPVNSNEQLNESNYKAVKKIMENRLANIGISEYIVRLNPTTGEIVVELPEEENTDEVISNLSYIGKFEIKDSEAGDVLMDNKDIKHASAVYGSTSSGTAVYLNIEFNKEGKRKLEDITKTYISSLDEQGNTQTKNISIEIDGSSMIKTYFEEPITTGILQLSIGSATVSNEEVSDYAKQARQVAGIIDSGVMPLQYELDENNYLTAATNDIFIRVIVGAVFVLIIMEFVYFVVRYKINGAFASIITMGLIAMILLIIRYTNVVISIEAIISLICILVSNHFVLQYALKQFANSKDNKDEIMKQTYKRYASILCPLYIIAIVFTFISWLPIASIGMNLFWGMTTLAVYDYITMKILLDVEEVKK